MARFCKKPDLERAVGGSAILIELLDRNQDRVADQDLVDYCIDAGCNELASYIEPTVALDSLSDPYPLVLVFKSAEAAAFYAWNLGSERQAAPQTVVDAYNAAIRWARDVGERRATLAASPKPALDPPAGLVNSDPGGRGVSVEGFKKGFR